MKCSTDHNAQKVFARIAGSFWLKSTQTIKFCCVLLCFVAVVAYQLCLKMGEVLGDGTEGNVFIQLFGDKGMTEQIQLRQAGNSKIRFEKGRTYKFTVETIDIGKVRFVRNFFS